MPTVNMKSVVLVNRRRVRPQTLQAIEDAKDGEMVLVDPSELDSFQPIVIYKSEVSAVRKGTKSEPKSS